MSGSDVAVAGGDATSVDYRASDHVLNEEDIASLRGKYKPMAKKEPEAAAAAAPPPAPTYPEFRADGAEYAAAGESPCSLPSRHVFESSSFVRRELPRSCWGPSCAGRGRWLAASGGACNVHLRLLCMRGSMLARTGLARVAAWKRAPRQFTIAGRCLINRGPCWCLC